MRRSRPFCRLCECPVVDGGVQASEVDRKKFAEWCLDVMDANLAHEVKRGDVICNFCVWDAEMLNKSHESDNGLRFKWWPNFEKPKPYEVLLKKNYLMDKVKPCLLQLEKVSIPENEEDLSIHEEVDQTPGKCIYCNNYSNKKTRLLSIHIKSVHPDVAIRCELRSCVTYFHTHDEREKHMLIHEMRKDQKTFDCFYCGKRYKLLLYRHHVNQAHRDIQVKCNFYGCFSYFNSQAELSFHLDTKHNIHDMSKIFKCDLCSYYTSVSKQTLELHITAKHLEKTLGCEKCNEMFSTEFKLRSHMNRAHVFKVCRMCTLNVSIEKYLLHIKSHCCNYCKKHFPCAGLMQSHSEICRTRIFKCDQCQKTYRSQSVLNYHINGKHQNHWQGLKYKNLGFKCDPCKRYYCSKIHLSRHIKIVHKKRGLKLCTHCPKKFTCNNNLESHLAQHHNFTDKKYECAQCQKTFLQKSRLQCHMKILHFGAGKTEKCKLCGTMTKPSNMSTHMRRIHGHRI